MENQQENRSFCAPASVLDTVAEQLADVDLTLPDYCPDIEKILKCSLSPKIQSKTLSGGQLSVDGVCTVTVLYVEAEHKTIRCCEHSVGFSQSFSARDAEENDIVLTATKPEYINCRALSPRRLVMHGAFSLYATVISARKTALFTPQGDDLEVLWYNAALADLRSNCQEQFTVSEEISVADKPAIEAVLYSKVNAGITDVKAVSGKLLVNGEISVRLFYLTNLETGETAKLDYLLPFTQMIDCDGVTEETENILGCEVMSYDVRLKNDILSDKPAVAFDAMLCVSAQGYAAETPAIALDAFSTSLACAPQFAPIKYVEEVHGVNDTFIEKLSAKIDNGKLSKILDIYADYLTFDTVFADNALTAKGRVNLCILALNEQNYPVFIERACDYERKLSADGCDSMLFGSARVASVSYRLSDDSSVDIRCELKISGGALRNRSMKAVTEVEIFEDKPLPPESCPLVLYFAKRGESLWNIAKAHSTRLDRLKAENAQEEPVLDSDQMLLIPTI